MHVYSVGEVQREAKSLLEEQFSSIWVEGEISDLSQSAAGHCYFTLKDDAARLSAVMWRSAVARMKFEPENGLAVRARGGLTIYERAGRYQFIVQRVDPLGAGPLRIRFEQMRKRLEQEGLFDARHKKPLPEYPRRVALVTSPTGAAVRDLIHVAHRRWPALEIVIVPARVQGDGAAEEIARAIAAADGIGVDIIVCGRGGGSLEDLWAFNEEIVARAIHAAQTPVVSAVGHEVDVSISDMVADARAATPSAAAETITPDRAELAARLKDRRQRLGRALWNRLEHARTLLDAVHAARPFARPHELLDDRRQHLDDLQRRIATALDGRLRDKRAAIQVAAGRLDALSPLKVLQRGYSVTLSNDRVVRDATDVREGDELKTVLGKGELRSRVL